MCQINDQFTRLKSTAIAANYVISPCALAKIYQACNAFCKDCPEEILEDSLKNLKAEVPKSLLEIMNRDGCCLVRFSSGNEVFYLRAQDGLIVEARKDLCGITYKPVDTNDFINDIAADKGLSISEAISELIKLPNDSEVTENVVENAKRIKEWLS